MRKPGKYIAVLALLAASPSLVHPQEAPLNPEIFLKKEMARRMRAIERQKRDRSAKAPTVQGTFDVIYYDLDLDIDPTSETVSGTVSSTVEVLAPSISSVAFDLHDSLTVVETHRDSISIPFVHAGDLVTLQLDRSFSLGETLRVSVTYTGHPQNLGFSSFSFGTHGNGEVAIASLSEPYYARTWWPCKDVPDDKALASIRITVPDTLIVASNGTLERIVSLGGGKHRYEWIESYPISTYLISVAISNYEVFSDYYVYSPADSMKVDFFVYSEDRANAEIDFDVTVPMIEFFSNTFSQYPFINEKYGMAEFEWMGAMEHQTCTSYGAHLVKGNHLYDWVIAHELAHQWWGDMITPEDWPDIWLNEGFATYSEALWVEHLSGFAAYKDYMRSRDQTSGFLGPIYDPLYLFSATVYWKGAWVLHMLRHVMGESTFFEALRSYASDPSFVYGNATTPDFQAVCESFYGSSLDWFFGEWVYGEFRPDYEYSWTQYRFNDLYKLSLTVRQVQTNGSFFVMPIDIRISLASGDTTVVVWNTDPSDHFSIDLPESVLALAFDPDDWILKYLQEVPTDASVVRAGPLELRNFPNPFNPQTRISFRTPGDGPVEVTIFGVGGELIRVLHRGHMIGGYNELVWDGRDEEGLQVSSGLYLIRVRTREDYAVRKAVLIK